MTSDRGWGAAVSRDDFESDGGRRGSTFSRLEIVARPYSSVSKVLEVTARGTIRNKEVFNRSYYQLLADAVVERFEELVDAWVLEYAEIMRRAVKRLAAGASIDRRSWELWSRYARRGRFCP